MAFKRFEPMFPPLPPQLQGYIWLDVEASSLFADSFPIEVGWCDCSLVADSLLLRPHARWTLEAWSQVSERLHCIPYAVLQHEGIDITVAAHRLNDMCRGRLVLSDNSEHDAKWLLQLFHDAGVGQAFTLHDAAQLERMAAVLARLSPPDAQALQERVKQHYPHPHLAAADARRAAALFLAVALPHEIDAVIAAA